MKLISMELYGTPVVKLRIVLPDTEVEDKNQKPFRVIQGAALKVTYKDENRNIYSKTLIAETGYCYDGASIPFKIGKGNMKLPVPALFHDIMCEDKTKIDRERNLSSQIFRELLIHCGVNKVIAQIMYLAVDNYQRFMKGWKDE